MRFSEWIYKRPDYEKVKESMAEYKTRIGSASSYDEMRKVWLDMKHSIEYFEYQEEIVYIRHLCGIDYENSLEEVKIQNSEEPYICDS